jgi:putative oxidoreductase
VAAGLCETGGGTLIALGLGTPVAGSVAAGTMIATASVHSPNGFFATAGAMSTRPCSASPPRRCR